MEMPVSEVEGWADFFSRRTGSEKIELLLAQILVAIGQISGNRNLTVRQVAPWLESEDEKAARIHAEQVARAQMVSEIYKKQRGD